MLPTQCVSGEASHSGHVGWPVRPGAQRKIWRNESMRRRSREKRRAAGTQMAGLRSAKQTSTVYRASAPWLEPGQQAALGASEPCWKPKGQLRRGLHVTDLLFSAASSVADRNERLLHAVCVDPVRTRRVLADNLSLPRLRDLTVRQVRKSSAQDSTTAR